MFAGSDFYARSHLDDMIGTLHEMPSLAQVAGFVGRFLESAQRHDGLDWVTALAIGGAGAELALHRKAWKCEHGAKAEARSAAAAAVTWQDSWGEWHALMEVDPVDDDLAPLKTELLDWPVGPSPARP